MTDLAHSAGVVIGILVANVLLVAVVVSLWLLIRDVRKLHQSGRSFADGSGNAAGVSPGGMLWQDNLGSH